MFVDSLFKLSSKIVAKCLVEKFRTKEGRYTDIIEILKTILNEKSRLNLRELTIEGYDHFERDWVEKLADLLPNLQILDFEFSDRMDVRAVCRLFPNLVHLNIRKKHSLKEIHHLKNLQTLCITGSVFKSSANLKGLFDLPNLRVLDVCESQGFFSNLLLLDGSFQDLRIIECDMSDITEQQLRTLVARNQCLEIISVIGTPCELVDFSDLPVTVLNLKTFKSCMSSLHNVVNRKEFNMVQLEKPIDRMTELLKKKRVGDGLKEDEFLKLMMEVTRKFPYFRDRKIQVTKCLIPYFKRIFPGQSMTEILRNLDPKSPLFPERRWAAQTVLRYFPEPVVCF
uniref:FTH domain-containing protein n=1 Tax=Caenorhabditis tropicalis TaxID=1561998 RepID=A0A1I7TUG4_9PELO